MYFDDVIIFSKPFDAHLMDADMELSTLREVGVSLILNSCGSLTDIVKNLGHIINPGALTIDKHA